MLHVTLSSGRRILALLLVFLSLLPVYATFANRTGSKRAQAGAGSKDYMPSVYKPAATATPTPTLPPPDELILEPYANGFETEVLVFIVNAGDERLFVGEQEGMVSIVDGSGNLLPTPFLDISDRIRTSNWEEGLQGLAFHPDYANNGAFYVSYNHPDDDVKYRGRIRVSRFQVTADANVADPNSETVLLEINKPYDSRIGDASPVHNAGDMHFGPDGYLYIAVGDGGPDPVYLDDPVPGDPYNHGQRADTLLGKILRIDVNGGPGLEPDCGNDNPDLGNHYTIPFDNPFADGPGGACDEIWAYGLRNPWRFSFDRLTGDMYIGDVGEWLREEVNFQPAGSPGGQNYGWHCWEGTYDHRGASHVGDYCDGVDFTFPIFEYSDGCSIIGGYVYRGSLFPQLQGYYLVTDFCNHLQIWGLKRDAAGQWQSEEMSFHLRHFWTTFGEGHDGELYLSYWDDNPSSKTPQTIYHIVAP